MHRDEVRALNQVRALDWTRTKTQVRYGHRAGFFRVVDKVALRVVWSFFTDDLDRVLVGAHGAVSAQPPEDGAHLVVGLGAE